MIKNILVPVDGSEGADRAIEKAGMLAEICGAKLNFLYVANINQLAINAVLSEVREKFGEGVMRRGSDFLKDEDVENG